MAKRVKKKRTVSKKKKARVQKTGFHLKDWYPAIGVFIFGFLLYANTIGHDFVLDDDIITRKNTFVSEGFGGLKDIFTHGYLYGFNGANDQSYRPLILANMAIETQLFGQNATTHHFFNVLIFAFSAVILFFFLSKAFRDKPLWLPLSITLLFVAHPIHTEVVANIKSRDEILSFTFGIATLLFVLKSALSEQNKYLYYGLVSYFLCVLSKETGLAVLGLVPFTLFFFTKDDFKQIGKTTAAFAVVAALYFIIRSSVMDSMTFEENMSPINNGLMAAESAGERFATNVSIMGRYLKLLLFPHPLSYDYSYSQIPIIGFGDFRFFLSLLAYIGLAVLAVLGLKNKNPISFGIILYVVMLILVSNFITPVGATMAERFIYSSSLGFCLILGVLLVNWFKVGDQDLLKAPTLFLATLGVILSLYSAKTNMRNMDWKNSETLYSSGLVTASNSARAHNHYASHYRELLENNPNHPNRTAIATDAINHYKRALEIFPEYSEASYNLGVLYYTMGQTDSALIAYENTLSFAPNYLNALNNSGVIYFERGDYNTALARWSKVIEEDPNNAQGLGNIGAIYQNSGNYNEAIQYYQRALSLNPNNPNMLGNIIKCYNDIGQPDQAKIYQDRLNQLRR
ncbi:MAG: tetratricopeptide repeat protein [Bacteroidota bacterium]